MSRRPRAAFTLLEVLAALVLMGIVLPVAMEGIRLATAAASQARRQLQAAALAETKLADLLATGTWEDTTLEGDFSPDQPDYRWNLDVQEWSDEGLSQVELRVTWTDHGVDRSVSLYTLVYTGSP